MPLEATLRQSVASQAASSKKSRDRSMLRLRLFTLGDLADVDNVLGEVAGSADL
jgi:hypothetical protein